MRAFQQDYTSTFKLPIENNIAIPLSRQQLHESNMQILDTFIDDLDEGRFEKGMSKFFNTMQVYYVLSVVRKWGYDRIRQGVLLQVPKFEVTYERDGFRLWRRK